MRKAVARDDRHVGRKPAFFRSAEPLLHGRGNFIQFALMLHKDEHQIVIKNIEMRQGHKQLLPPPKAP